MKYCSNCGSPVQQRVPDGDNLPRHVCDNCNIIHYSNPKIVAGAIPVWENRILLCKRAIEPRYGFWTLPAGFMENDETTPEAAARETWEEAGARLNDITLYGVFNLPHINQVYMMFRGDVVKGRAEAGTESLEVALFDESAIPWEELAFPVIKECLELFFQDRKQGHFPVRMGDIVRRPDRSLQIVRY
jgi:ADP-ribose pyrophosphatase YjhB (NUDIX family)